MSEDAELISMCCRAPSEPAGDADGTRWYQCSACGQPGDPIHVKCFVDVWAANFGSVSILGSSKEQAVNELVERITQG